ncbi:hypothetical protein FALBO_15619 [Fusarium albosuccineum]|uniref:Uncharacterized protein n=1 Tax=Fusarium albosuccineum TaxID=1237068 RepID=A0A8H4KTF5_9HYPO|nr:hypothetical protein FALBO_15619 [Fusarium albosuccineum]
MFSGPSSDLRDAVRQLGLARRGFGEADYAPAEHAVILKKVQSREFGSFSLLEYQIDSYEDLGFRLGSGDIIILLADETYRNQPSEDLLLGVFHKFDIPVGDYLDMIASFFLVQPPRATPKYLRPTAYPESAADLRFPNCSYNVPVSDVGSHSSNLPELCYKFYVVDASPTATRTRIFSYSDSPHAVTPVLVDVPKIHKCVVLIKPVSDYVIVTTTHRGLSGRFLNIRYPLGGFFGKAVTVSAAQYVLAESGSLGWDICLDSIESGMEGLLQEVRAIWTIGMSNMW